jgi:hypothetical protein
MVIIMGGVCQNAIMAFPCKDNLQALLGDYIHIYDYKKGLGTMDH